MQSLLQVPAAPQIGRKSAPHAAYRVSRAGEPTAFRRHSEREGRLVRRTVYFDICEQYAIVMSEPRSWRLRSVNMLGMRPKAYPPCGSLTCLNGS